MRLDGDAASAVVGMTIVSKTRREAAKLYGLVLYHHGLLRALGEWPCVIVVEDNKGNGQSFRAWNAESKIYVECVVPGRRVSEKSYVSLFFFLVSNILCYVYSTLSLHV